MLAGLRGQPPVGIVTRIAMGSRAHRCLRRAPAVLLVLVGGCAWDGPRSTLVADSDFARAILDVYAIITWASLGIAAVVSVVLVWVLLRFRARPDRPTPRQVRGHTALEIAWTIAPAVVLLVVAIPTIQVIFQTSRPAPSGALEVTVRGRQWWWEFHYPSLKVVTANELHLPAGRAAVLLLEGPDVIHSFWVPRLGGKRDVVPGRRLHITLTPETPGEYPGQCAEFCGASHALMGLRVIVQEPAAFDRWVAAQQAPPAEPAGEAAEGKAIYARSACVGCHTIQGVSVGVLGPDLTHFGSRTTLGAGLLPNTPDNLVAWLRDPAALKPAVKMPDLGLGEPEARALAAYLLSLK
jgi:cytochrome c oxidase subunit 2